MRLDGAVMSGMGAMYRWSAPLDAIDVAVKAVVEANGGVVAECGGVADCLQFLRKSREWWQAGAYEQAREAAEQAESVISSAVPAVGAVVALMRVWA